MRRNFRPPHHAPKFCSSSRAEISAPGVTLDAAPKFRHNLSIMLDMSMITWIFFPVWVGWLWIKCHIHQDQGTGTLTLFQGNCQPVHMWGLRRLPRCPPGNRARVAGAEAQMHALVPTVPTTPTCFFFFFFR